MANREACELYIEQQIEEALEDGKTPYAIGKEISEMVERLFETKMPAKTLESRAKRMKDKLTSNEVNEENQTNLDGNGGNTGNIPPKKIAEMVQNEVERTGSERKAALEVARVTGKNEGSVRVAYQREKKKEIETEAGYSHDMIKEQFEKSFNTFRTSILNIKALKYKTIPREIIIGRLEELYQLVK